MDSGTKRRVRGEIPLLEHIRELRGRIIVSAVALIIASVAGYVFYDRLAALLSGPFAELPLRDGSGEENRLYMTSLFEGFSARIQVSLLAGFVLSFPVHLFNAVRFVFPGLTVRERRVFAWTLFASAFLAVGSLAYGYSVIVPLVVRVLTGSAFLPERVGLLLNYQKSIFLVFQFVLASLLLFQVPLVAELLMIMNVVSRRTMTGAFRYAVVGIFILSAILTPPDIISQVLVAVPLVGLFGLALLIARIFRFGEG